MKHPSYASIVIWVGIVFVLVLTIIGCMSALPTFKSSAYYQIKEGMTKQEVISILGVPPDSYRTDPMLLNSAYGKILATSGVPVQGGDISIDEWLEDRYGIAIAFDKKGRVIGTQLFRMQSYDSPPARWIRDVLDAIGLM